MSLLSLAVLRNLAEQPEKSKQSEEPEQFEKSEQPCVSIFLPTVVAGAEIQQNAIRFKNVIRQAATLLQEQYDFSESAALDYLQPAIDLDEETFWQHQDQGLAIFVGADFLKYYRLPSDFEELVVVSDRFHLKPLMPFLIGNDQFYILTLSQKEVKLFTANRYYIREVEVPDLPQSLAEVLQYDETAREGQFRIGTSASNPRQGSRQAGVFHGQGSPDRDQHQKDILQFFHAVDQALHALLHEQRIPLMLVAIEYLLPLYREANTYPFLLETSLNKHPESLTPEALHQEVLPLIQPQLDAAKQDAIEHYQEMTSTGKTSTDLEETIAAAYYGRVEQLFVAVGLRQWGKFDPESNQLDVHAEQEPGDEDLLNAAAVQTLLNGGTVYAVEPDAVPSSAPVAAVFRY